MFFSINHALAINIQNIDCTGIKLDYTWFGCWLDESDAIVPDSLTPLEGESDYLDGNYTDRTDRVHVIN